MSMDPCRERENRRYLGQKAFTQVQPLLILNATLVMSVKVVKD